MIIDAYIRKEFVSGSLRHQVLEVTTSWNQYHRIVRLTPSPVSDIVAPHQREARVTDTVILFRSPSLGNSASVIRNT